MIQKLKPGDVVRDLLPVLRRYKSDIYSHMQAEEDDLVPLVHAYFSPKEMSQITRAFFSNGPKVSKWIENYECSVHPFSFHEQWLTSDVCLVCFCLALHLCIVGNDGLLRSQHGEFEDIN